MALEVERKYLSVDFDALRKALYKAGASCAGAHFESNAVFDTPDRQLFSSGRLLRLRTQHWPQSIEYRLTFKAPATGQEGFKVRQEQEVAVADAAAMQAVLEGLGYALAARYEKVRETWSLHFSAADAAHGAAAAAADGGPVEIVLDVLPFAHVVEMEGSAASIERATLLLGLDKAVMSTKNYHELHQQWRKEQHLPPQHSFVFSEEQARRWRERLGLCRR